MAMLRVGLLACCLLCFTLVGCGGSKENSIPAGLAPPTVDETKAMEDYTASQEIDPATGQPKGQ